MCIASKLDIDLTENDDNSAGYYNDLSENLIAPWRRNASVIVYYGTTPYALRLLEALESRKNNESDNQNFFWLTSDGIDREFVERAYNSIDGWLGFYPTFKKYPNFSNWFTEFVERPNINWTKEYKVQVNCNQTCTADNSDYTQSFVIDAVFALADSLSSMQKVLCNTSYGLYKEMLDSERPSRINGEILRQYLQLNSIVEFDNNQDRKGGYTVYNLQRGLKDEEEIITKKIGFWEAGKLNIDNAKFQNKTSSNIPQSLCSELCPSGYFEDHLTDPSCCWRCQPCGIGEVSDGKKCVQCNPTDTPSSDRSKCITLPLEYLLWDSGWSITIILFSIIGLILSISSTVLYIYLRKKHEIAASNPTMGAVILIGVIVSFLLPYFYLGRPTPPTCAIRRIGIGLSFNISFGALLIKIIRIYRIISRILSRQSITLPRFISWKSQLLFILLIVLGQVIISAIWLAAEPPNVRTTVLEDFEKVELHCAANPLIGVSITLVYNAILLFACVVFTILTRKVPPEYNEARIIHATVLVLLVMWIAFIPTYYATYAMGDRFIIKTNVIAILLTAFVLLFFFIIHKIFATICALKKQKTSSAPAYSGNMSNDIPET